MGKFFSGKNRKEEDFEDLSIYVKKTKSQIDEIIKGIDVKKSMGENSYTHHSGTKKFYIDEVRKYFQGKGFTFQILPTESVVSYKIKISW